MIEETETTRLVRDGNGAVLRWIKGSSGAPEHVDFLVKDRPAWEDHIRPHLVNDGNCKRRVNFDLYRAMRAHCAKHNLFLTCGVVGTFDLMTPLCGHEHLLAGMALDPDWARDMVQVLPSSPSSSWKYYLRRKASLTVCGFGKISLLCIGPFCLRRCIGSCSFPHTSGFLSGRTPGSCRSSSTRTGSSNRSCRNCSRLGLTACSRWR